MSFSNIPRIGMFRTYVLSLAWLIRHKVLHKTTSGDIVLLTIYVDDIIVTSNDKVGISDAKAPHQHFVTQVLQTLHYFFGIEFSYQSRKLALSKRKYALDLFQDMRLLGFELETSSMESQLKDPNVLEY